VINHYPEHQFPGQVCPDCGYAYDPAGFRVCSNPVCLNNPNLSEAKLTLIRQRIADYRAQQIADKNRRKLYALSFKSRA
jgi:hypothetical protein